MDAWYFAYGTSTSPERFQAAFGPVETFKPGTIHDHRLTFSSPDPAFGGGTSCIVPAAGDKVIGTAFALTPSQAEKVRQSAANAVWTAKKAVIDGREQDVSVLLPPRIASFAEPADSYVSLIREGLSYLYPMVEVEPYLRRALGRPLVFKEMKAQWVDEAVPNEEYNIGFRRLYPWKGVVRAPWGGAWGTIRPGTSTELFTHDEEETAIVVAGSGEARVNDERRPVKRGDVLYFQPDCEHVLTNTAADTNLEVLFIWWGGKDGALWGGRRI